MVVINKYRSNFNFHKCSLKICIAIILAATRSNNVSHSFVLSPPLLHKLNYGTTSPSLLSITPSRSFINLRAHEDGVGTEVKGQEEEELDEETILRFQGVGRLYEQEQKVEERNSESYTEIIHKLQKSTVAIVGIGGVGSWAAESICRSGVGNIILVDLDDVCISNTNRQLHATSASVGKMKINVMKERLLDINPKCNVSLIHDFITEDNAFDIVEGFQKVNSDSTRSRRKVDVIIDAIDGNAEKAALIAAACVKDIPIVTCGGAAGRIDPSQIICQDLSQSIECKLLFWTKKKLRNHYRLFPNSNNKKVQKKWRIPAVFSTEKQKKVDEDSPSFRKCDGALGTACFVTGTYGMIAASHAINIIANNVCVKPRLVRSSVKYWNEVHEKSKEGNVTENSMINSI